MAEKEQLERLTRSIEEWNLWREQYSILQPDLSGADLGSANLRYADLRYANLSNADLSRTDLSRSDLDEADLSHTRMWGTILGELNLSSVKGLEMVPCGTITLEH